VSSKDGLLAIFSEVLGVPCQDLSDETSPENTPKWDSLAAMMLVSALEDRYDVTLSTKEIMKMRSISIVREVLRAKGVAGV
jgi:acyl carrier protein